MKRLLFMLLILTGCGPEFKKDPVVVDEELAEYAHRFEQDIGVGSGGISMAFGVLEGNTVGLCSIGPSGRKITIDSEYWSLISESQKEELMYHELGHCAMELDHDEGLLPNNCPVSIMYPYTFDYCYARYTSHYKEELRSKRSSRALSSMMSHEISCDVHASH